MPVGDQYRLFPPKSLVNRRATENLIHVIVTSPCPVGLSAQVFAQERDVVLATHVGGFADDRGVGGLDHRDE